MVMVQQTEGSSPSTSLVRIVFVHVCELTMTIIIITRCRAIAGRAARCCCMFYAYRILQRHRAVCLPQHALLVGLCLQTAIALKRVKIEEKLLWRAYRKSQTLFRTVPTSTPYGLLFPQPHPQNFNRYLYIISGTGKATGFKLGWRIHRSIRTKGHSKFWRKGSVCVSRDCQIF